MTAEDGKAAPTPEGHVWNFAFGSNLCPEKGVNRANLQIEEVVPGDAVPVDVCPPQGQSEHVAHGGDVDVGKVGRKTLASVNIVGDDDVSHLDVGHGTDGVPARTVDGKHVGARGVGEHSALDIDDADAEVGRLLDVHGP